jgi:glycosyltransferase involved in cell wall biosynthesis
MSKRSVYINWGVSSFFGWGVYGLNLALNWSHDPDLEPIGARAIATKDISVDPLRGRVLGTFLQRSAAFHSRLEQYRGGAATVQAPVIHGLDEDFVMKRVAHDVLLQGAPNLAATFFETARLDPDAVARAAELPLIVAGSTWNARILQAHGLTNVRTVLQGIDPTLFHPAPRQDFLADRFLVFSGGKLERRKGQDIVLAAFRIFAERHPEAMLVTIWKNAWPQPASDIDAGDLTTPVPFDAEGQADIAGWAAANGLGPANFTDLGFVPNAQLPTILREMDAAVFANRAEGGTNLVAMEAMACGVPTILSRNTGHLDLIEDDNCYPLTQQGALAGREGRFEDVEGWGESDVGEVVDALERAFADRDEARRRGGAGAATLSRLTWARTAAEMKRLVLETAAPAKAHAGVDRPMDGGPAAT